MPNVNSEILRWARETAGLSLEEAAQKLKISESKGASPSERLADLEAGEAAPSRPMLVKMAQHYRRPLVTFYLSSPPRRGDRGRDFRRLPDSHSLADDALLDTLIRRVQARQSMVRAVLEDEEEAELLAFVASMTTADGVKAVLKSIQKTLNVTVNDFRAAPSPREAFALLRHGAETAGVFVLLIGDLGSYHTAIKLESFRGYALADQKAPFVVINHGDSKPAWCFTLLHELAHVWLGETGVSGPYGDIAIERFCNDVASEFLLPTKEFEQFSLGDSTDIQITKDRISRFAEPRYLSSSLVAYRLYRAGAIDQATWRALSKSFSDSWRQFRASQRARARDQDGGPSTHIVRGHRLGAALLDLVARMLHAGALTTSKAGTVLGVRAKHVQTLLEQRERARTQRPV